MKPFFETMPDSINARAKYWLKFLEKTVCITEDDVIIGWSSGAVAAMRYAETHSYAGLILIGPHYTDLGLEDEKASGYFDAPWDWEAIKNNVKKIMLVHSDNDPYIPREDFLYIAAQLECERIEVHGARHFEERTEIPEMFHSFAYFTNLLDRSV